MSTFKVKIGNKIYDSEETPIMVIMSEEHRKTISSMQPKDGTRKYVVGNASDEELKTFMKTGE